MRKFRINFFLRSPLTLLLFLITNSILFSQSYNFRNYSLDDGLSQSEINCVFEDSRGYLWIGTAGGGLCRFDGKEFKTYEEKDGLCGQIITSVSEDANHTIWIGNQNGGLCKFDGQTFSIFSEADKKYFLKQTTKFISIDDNNNTIVGLENSILLFNGKQFEPLKIKGDTISAYAINCFKKDSRNILWIGTNKGLLVLKNKTLLRISDADFSNDNITALTEDKNGNLWAVENNTSFYKIKIIGPSHYQVKITKVDSIVIPKETSISDIHFDQQNQLWIATYNKGVFKFLNAELKIFNQTNGLPVENIKNIFEDKSNNLWFGTSGGGLVKFTNRAFTYYDNLNGFNEPDIFALNADKEGNMWAGTSLHGVYKYDGKSVVHYDNSTNVGSSEVRCVFTDSKGKVWAGTNNGLFIFNGKSFSPYNSQLKTCKNIRAIFEDKAGNIWIGTKGHGAFIDNGKELIQITNELGLTNENIYSFVQNRKGSIWIGTGNGIYIYDAGKIINHIKDELCNSYAGSMVTDKFDNIWIGTDKCVIKYDGKSFQNISTQDGLTSGTIYLLNTDKFGNIWVGTNKGLDKISLNEKGEISGFKNFGKAEGFKGVECNSRATCIDAYGCLWFGTIKGAIKFDPEEELMVKPEIPFIHITGIKLFYENGNLKLYSDTVSDWFNLPVNPIFPYSQNHITFYFSAISKTLPEKIKYNFILEGFDKDWSPSSEIPSATYSNLPAGTYKFIVRATNKAGISSQTPCEFNFTISAPFWTTWWFIGICVLSFIFLIYLYNEYRKRKHRLYKERLEKIIKERTSEIIKKRDENEILLKEVHHRVKNNLQIINSLINLQASYVQDEKSIELFHEIRNRIRTISLIHEKLYKSKNFGSINVEEYINMLFENLNDTYNIGVKVELKLDLQVQFFNLNTIIPLGLLLNEIISNAFKYAYNDTEKGLLEISLVKSDGKEEYTLIIGDNGKGFEDDLFNGNASTLGLELMKILSEQLNGSIEKINKTGTYYLLKFKPI